MRTPATPTPLTLAVALAALVVCLWIGWSDFDPYLGQDVVRDSIRAAPRVLMQTLVQFVAPVLLAAFLARAAIARWRVAHAT
jgi:hypothetical protein